jgi:hypothetical protein
MTPTAVTIGLAKVPNNVSVLTQISNTYPTNILIEF